MNNVKNLELKSSMYERVKVLLNIDDLERIDANKINSLSMDSYTSLGSVFFEDGVEGRIGLVSGMRAYWIEVQLYRNNEAISEMYQFYTLNNVMDVTEDGKTYSVVLTSENDVFDVVSYCWSNLNEKLFDEQWEDCCQDGDLVFKVPKGWLISKLLSDESFNTNRIKIEEYSEKTYDEIISLWNDIYTHEEGYRLFCEAITDDVIKEMKIEHCDYCSKL